MKTHAIYPGTFDPLTLGHLSILENASMLFDKVTVLLATNPDKQPMFPIGLRKKLAQTSIENINLLCQVEILAPGDYVVQWIADSGIIQSDERPVIIRGLRDGADFDYEFRMARNNNILGNYQTVFLLGESQHAHVSSSLVRMCVEGEKYNNLFSLMDSIAAKDLIYYVDGMSPKEAK